MSDNFRKAKDVYYERIRLPDVSMSMGKQSDPYEYDPDTKYARAARLGLCFRCFSEDTDPETRPMNRGFAFCKKCMNEMDKGIEKLEHKNQNEVNKWFK